MKSIAMARLTTVVLMLAGLACPTPAASQAISCTLPEMATDRRPDPDGTPTLVTVGLDLIDLQRIDAITQQITVDLLVMQNWRDERLKELAGCRAPLSEVWSPRLDFVNSGRLFPGLQQQVRIGEDGSVTYLQRHRGALSFPHSLRDFPFDRQTVKISLAVLASPKADVKLLIDEDFTKRSVVNSIQDWRVGRAFARAESLLIINPADPPHAQFDFLLEVERRAEYYIWKLIVPLMLIVAMSWSVFWLNPARYGPQIGLSATSMLTLIAFQFAMVGILPRLSYFTLLDQFIAASTVLVFLALLETLTTAYLVSIEKTAIAQRLDNVCRWLFPLAFAAISVLVFWG